MVPVPESIRDLLERPIPAALVTLMPSGQPQATPVWFDYDGQYFRVNTARGRQKDRNMTNRSKVTLLVIDPNNAYHWFEVRGHIAEVTENGALAHIDQLAKKYTGGDKYKPQNPDEVRVMYKIEADKINAR